jgi:hypothetical protein
MRNVQCPARRVDYKLPTEKQMTTASVTIRVPNSILIVRDPSQEDFPEITRDSNIWVGRSCILMHSLPDFEGETSITLGGANEVHPENHVLFDDVVETPSRAIHVDIVPGKTVLSRQTKGTKTRVRIWTDGGWTPELVTIGVD